MLNQEKTPIFSNVKKHAAQNPIPFHIPGHKKGKGKDPEFRNFIGDNALSIDLINIQPLDDLHHPRGSILESQKLAAEAFGADHSFFCVQGTSGAILLMILSVISPGDKIILPRNVHQSVFSAIIFSGAHPIFIHPEMDARMGIAHGITAKEIEKTLLKHPDAKAVLIINPTYYGITSDLKVIVDLVHSYHIPVLVDEAHGALTHFHDDLPLSAMQAGADLSATSVHKLGGSLTQSSILNVKKGFVNPDYVQSINTFITTTSSSYLLLSSLDTARRYLYLHGQQLIQETLQLARHARKKINHMPGLSCFGPESLNCEAIYGMDETKLFIHLSSLTITGNDAELWLRDHYNIEVELSDLHNLLCLITPGDTEETVRILLDALAELSQHYYLHDHKKKIHVSLPEIPELILSPRDAFYHPKKAVSISEAAGKVSGEFLMTYPPGIPIFVPGEKITQKNIQYIEERIQAGLSVYGTTDPSLQSICVLE